MFLKWQSKFIFKNNHDNYFNEFLRIENIIVINFNLKIYIKKKGKDVIRNRNKSPL